MTDANGGAQDGMSAMEVLTTTRSVRKRLELERPVPRELVARCVELALQAPSSSNSQVACFIAVDDAERRAALAELYRRAWSIYEQRPSFVGSVHYDDAARQDQQDRVTDSAHWLADNIHAVPVLVIPCIDLGSETGQRLAASGFGRDRVLPVGLQATAWGSILPAAWSFMLAARAHGLGSAWTALHLYFEREAAEILDVPFESVIQAALLPVAHTSGSFRKAPRAPVSEVLHWNTW
jgi:nitroreductase